MSPWRCSSATSGRQPVPRTPSGPGCSGRSRRSGYWTVVRCDDAALFQRHECHDEPGPVKDMWLEMQVVAEGSQTRFILAIGCQASAGPLTRPLAKALSRKLRTGNHENVRRFAALAECAVRSG